KSARHDPERGGGACGFPMLDATLGAMQLLGFLLYTDQQAEPRKIPECKAPGCMRSKLDQPYLNGRTTPRHYWTKVLTPSASTYLGKTGLADVLIDLIRNPLAHSFAVAPNVVVHKGDRKRGHLKSDGTRLFVDAAQFATDFRASYAALIP